MSYYKCKGISRKGNKIEVNVASSNCFPITYYKSEYKQRVCNCKSFQNEKFEIHFASDDK